MQEHDALRAAGHDPKPPIHIRRHIGVTERCVYRRDAIKAHERARKEAQAPCYTRSLDLSDDDSSGDEYEDAKDDEDKEEKEGDDKEEAFGRR